MPEGFPGEDSEPDLDLIQPGAVLRGVSEPDAVTAVGEECLSGGRSLQDASSLFHSEISGITDTFRHKADRRFGLVRVELVGENIHSADGWVFTVASMTSLGSGPRVGSDRHNRL